MEKNNVMKAFEELQDWINKNKFGAWGYGDDVDVVCVHELLEELSLLWEKLEQGKNNMKEYLTLEKRYGKDIKRLKISAMVDKHPELKGEFNMKYDIAGMLLMITDYNKFKRISQFIRNEIADVEQIVSHPKNISKIVRTIEEFVAEFQKMYPEANIHYHYYTEQGSGGYFEVHHNIEEDDDEKWNIIDESIISLEMKMFKKFHCTHVVVCYDDMDDADNKVVHCYYGE